MLRSVCAPRNLPIALWPLILSAVACLWQPAALIDGLITEHGIITKPPGASGFDVAAFVSKHKQR